MKDRLPLYKWEPPVLYDHYCQLCFHLVDLCCRRKFIYVTCLPRLSKSGNTDVEPQIIFKTRMFFGHIIGSVWSAHLWFVQNHIWLIFVSIKIRWFLIFALAILHFCIIINSITKWEFCAIKLVTLSPLVEVLIPNHESTVVCNMCNNVYRFYRCFDNLLIAFRICSHLVVYLVIYGFTDFHIYNTPMIIN